MTTKTATTLTADQNSELNRFDRRGKAKLVDAARLRTSLKSLVETAQLDLLNDRLVQVATLEGFASMMHDAVMVLQFKLAEGTSWELALAQTSMQMTAMLQIDDTWSGRGNDLRRAKFEGQLNAVKDFTNAQDF